MASYVACGCAALAYGDLSRPQHPDAAGVVRGQGWGWMASAPTTTWPTWCVDVGQLRLVLVPAHEPDVSVAPQPYSTLYDDGTGLYV